ncbi:hypothetical protein J4050_01295 [Winogradskyella sp. DF17]|jgi:hypothetical protein|uniref:Lipoprotein n=1 Tax=Winogradskyella pelagia TaxID=2819984 RepID=A0ABS3T0U0_9FLAO|nr:hypothetical protein [Winogradskyella sp. DF17]MBO3115360.1 hypothetical protein [Winogradskyella sp. DF17]
MRFLSGLIVFVTILGSCKSKEAMVTTSDKDIAAINETKDMVIADETNIPQYNKIAVAYRSSTRGVFEYTYISEEETMLTEDRNFKNTRTYPTKKEDWQAILEFIIAVDEDKFRNLEAPTSMRHYDGAPHATLSIIKGDEELMTPSFDHGHPPKEILNFVAKVLSVRDNLIKQ